MSEKEKIKEDKTSETVYVARLAEGTEMATDMDEVDEVDSSAEEEAPEKTAILVVGQGDFGVNQSNRGADDPGDNTFNMPQCVCKYGEMLFISDRGNHRVLVWHQMPLENGEPANLVLGQEDFADCLENRGITTTLDEMTSGLGSETLEGYTISHAEGNTMSAPAGLAVIDGKLYVVDGGNHRVLRWNTLPSEDGEAAHFVLGQDNLEANNSNRSGVVSSGSLFFPIGIRSGDDQHVFVADKDNHRVLIWNKIPFNNGWQADVVLGQAHVEERMPNRGEFDRCGPETLSFPTGACHDPVSGRVYVVDQGNNRVLIWNKLPNESGTPADIVIGQKDFYNRSPNFGEGSRRANREGLYFPTDVVFGRKGLFVSDTGNNRVLVWKTPPTENGQPADIVIGQGNFTDNRVNRGGETNATTLNDPYGLFLDEDPENAEDPGRLYIADRANSRVVVWEELPEPSKGQEQKADPENVVYEQDELMGSDDDFDDEDDMVPSKNLPVA